MNLTQSLSKPGEKPLFVGNRSLRTRLLATSIALALIPLLVVGIIATLISSQGLRSEVFNQLEIVVTLKENQVLSWLKSLQTNLDLVVAAPDTLTNVSTLVTNPDSEDANPIQVRNTLTSYKERSGYFTEIFIMDMDGRVVMSTDKDQEGKILKTQSFFHQGLVGPNITPPSYELSLQNYSIVVSQPLLSRSGRVIGVLAGRANLDTLNEIMIQRSRLGNTGETYVVNSNNAVLTSLRFEEITLGQTYINTQGVVNVVQQKENGSATYQDYRGEAVVGVYHWIPELQIAVLAEQDQSEAYSSVNELIQVTIGLFVVTILIAILAAFLISQSITSPISKLAQAAQEISRGNLEQNVEVVQQDEIGVLANSFNLMTSQLRELIGSLEQRVADRTKALATVAEIGTATSTILETEKLLQQVVDLAKERFNLYHAHIYLLNEEGDTLVLASGAGEPGRQMVAEKRSIALNREQSLVARAAREKKGVTVNDVTQTADFLPNPLLPDTHSELAVPMIVGDRVIGVFDVQSEAIGRFTDSDIAIQTTLASQVASAIQNARSYTEIQRSQELLSDALQVAKLGNWEYDFENDLFHFTDEFYSIFQTSVEKVGGYKISSADYAKHFVHPDDASLVASEIQRAWDSKDRLFRTNLEHRIIFPDGETGYVSSSINVERDENGKIVRWYGANQDITQRKLAEAAIAKRAQELASVAEISTSSSLELNVQKMLESVVYLTQRRFGLYHAHVFIFDEETQNLVITACGWKEGDEHEGTHGTTTIPLLQEQSLVARAARTRRSVIVNDVRNEPGWLPNPLLPDTASELAVPMIVGDQLLGVLDVQSDKINAFTEQDANIQTTLASQVATALQNAQSYSKAQSALTQSEKLFETSRSLTQSNNLQELVLSAVEGLDIPEIDRAFLGALEYTSEDELSGMMLIANWSRSADLPATPIGTHYPKEMLSSLSLFTGSEPIFIDDMWSDERIDETTLALAKRVNFRAVAALPLFVGSRQSALLLFQGKQPHTFTSEEIRLFTTLAPQLATVMENRRQFERTQKQAEREAMLNAINQKIQSATSVESVLQIAARELGHALGAPMTIAQLSMKDSSSS